MKSTFRKRIVAALTTLGVMSSIVIGAGIGNTIESKQLEVYAFESENSSHVTTAYIEVENAMFPMHNTVYISQTAYEAYSHFGFDKYRGYYYESNAMDVFSDDLYFHAPFTGQIVNFSDSCNCFAFESNQMVRFADNTLDYMTVYVLHSEEYQKIKSFMSEEVSIGQYEKIVKQGGAAAPGINKYNDHLDIQVAKGRKLGVKDDVKLNGEVFAYNSFFVNEEKTWFKDYTGGRCRISNGNEYANFVGAWQYDQYNGNWANSSNSVFKPTNFDKSLVRITAQNSLAFEEEYSLSDLLFGDVIFEQAQKLDTINRIVNTYTSLDYDALDDFEKQIFDSCTYEWVDSLSTETSTEENNVKAEAIVEVTEPSTEQSTESETARPEYTVKFDANGGICDVQEINVTWGVCSNEPFPTPEKFGCVFQGWFDLLGTEYTSNSIFEQDITLYAKWHEFPESLLHEETKIVIAQTAPAYVQPNIIQTESPTTYTTTVPVEIAAESISLNRSQIMLNTAGSSRTYQLYSTINPVDVTDSYVSWSSSDPSVAAVDAGLVVAKSDGSATITAKTKNGKTAICTVTVKTSYDKIKGEWTEYTTTPIYESSTIEVETKNVVEKVLWGYTTDSYSTRTWSKLRQYRNFSIDPAKYGLDTGYGENPMSAPWMFNTFLTFSKEEFSNFRVIHPDEWSTGSQSGQNKASVDGYEYYDGYIIFIKEKIYNDITTTYYRSRTITEAPTVYVN